jgi:catechol 2,3-dioxygenase-like lactoylglutathione lyase family enzyme
MLLGVIRQLARICGAAPGNDPVSDVDRAKEFYARLGWRLDADYDKGKDFRVIQFTPPGSGCSVIWRINSATTNFASVSDLASALRRAEAAHGEHEKRTGGQRDANWPDWYAQYMAAEQAGTELPDLNENGVFHAQEERNAWHGGLKLAKRLQFRDISRGPQESTYARARKPCIGLDLNRGRPMEAIDLPWHGRFMLLC